MNGLGLFNAYLALSLANEHGAALRRQADRERLVADRPRSSRLREIAAGISGIGGRLSAIDGNDGFTPKLSDYPYRA